MSRSRSAVVLLSAALLVLLSSCKNRPPAVPSVPDGPTVCSRGRSYTFSTDATDPEGESVAIRMDWGDSAIGDWTAWLSSGEVVALNHAWSDTGTYAVMAQARDQKLHTSDWSGALSVRVAPGAPAAPTGPDFCFTDKTYTFKSAAADAYFDSVSVRFAWDDGDTSAWSAFVAAGESVAMSHKWSAVETYRVTAQERSRTLENSGWSDGLSVRVVVHEVPNTPTVPDGPPRGGIDSTYALTASATHPQNLPVAIRFDWGDGDTSAWSAWVASGTIVSDTHTWIVADTLFVRAQARDTGNALSAWSDQHRIVIRPKDTLSIWRYLINAGTPTSNYSSPAIGPDGAIYVGSQDNYLYAVNSDGTLKWKFLTGGPVRSSPAIGADGTVYVGSNDNHLYAINPNGRLNWSCLTHDNVTSSPAIAADGTIIFGSNDDTIYALNPDSTVRWKYPTGQDVNSSPSIAADGTVYCGSNDDYLYALTSGGAFKWRYSTGRDIVGSPAIGSDGTVYIGSLDGYLCAVDTSGSPKWSVLTNGLIQSSPVIGNDGTIYVGSHDDILYALNPDGSTKWRYVTGDDVNSSPAISANGTVYFGSNDNNLYALSPDSIPVFVYPTDYDIESSPAIGADGKVYFVGFDGYLYQLKGTSPLAGTSWPKFRHDIKNNGRVSAKEIK